MFLQRICKIIVVLILVGVRGIYGQSNSPKFLPKPRVLTSINGKLFNSSILRIPAKVPGPIFSGISDTRKMSPGGPAADFYVNSLTGFCRLEWKVEKQFNVPLRLRLGSLDYTNKLEGKKQ